MSMVSVSNLTVKIGEQTVLNDVSFVISSGEIAAVIGPNGSGKTTLIRAILGLIPHEQGEILIQDEPVKHQRSLIGYLPQKLYIDSEFPITVKEYLSLSYRRTDSISLSEKIQEVGLTDQILNQRLGTLSGGQLQRVLIAQATLHHPKVLFLDEPSTGIDMVGEKQFYELIRTQRDLYGTTVILVSHDISVIAKVVDQVICVNKRLICFGPPKSALTPETIFELYGHAESSLYHHRH